VGGHFGMRAVFIATSLLLVAGAFYTWTVARRPELTRIPEG